MLVDLMGLDQVGFTGFPGELLVHFLRGREVLQVLSGYPVDFHLVFVLQPSYLRDSLDNHESLP